MGFRGCGVFGKGLGFGLNAARAPLSSTSRNLGARARSVAMEKSMFRYLGEFKGFVEELRFQAMRLHATEQAGERGGPSMEGYLRFLVDSKKVYETMEAIITNSSHPSYEVFRKMELVRARRLMKELRTDQKGSDTVGTTRFSGMSAMIKSILVCLAFMHVSAGTRQVRPILAYTKYSFQVNLMILNNKPRCK